MPHSHRQQQRTEPIEVDEVIALLRSIELHRAALDANAAEFAEWLEISDDLAVAWGTFTSQGGITAADFDQFMLEGRLQQRGRPVRQRRHLRLISR